MTETNVKKKRLSISPKNFEDPNGVVGLGILAALNDHNQDPISGSRILVLAVSPKYSSNPIPIRNDENSSRNNCSKKPVAEKIDQLCEEYTCVLSHLGDDLIEKTEYFYGKNCGSERVYDAVVGNGGGAGYGGETADFLSSCFLCKTMLHGLDIFMYRGDKAFCSADCRGHQISIDEQKKKRRSRTTKPKDYSVSPCSGALQFFAGVAAA